MLISVTEKGFVMDTFKSRLEIEKDLSVAGQTDAPPPVDAVIRVSLADRGLQACVNILPPESGGAAPTVEALNAALIKTGVTYNVDAAALQSIAQDPIYYEDIPVAKGLAPVNGEDGTATFLIRTEKSTLVPKTNEDGTVDYHDLDIVENVAKGQTLCTITKPTEGTPGITVLGKELTQKKGRPVPSYVGRNTELAKDGLSILSRIDGQAEFSGKINVDETFYVKGNIDNSTGNLNVVGNLNIAGHVMPGFTVEAARTVEIRGTVESATIKSGGDMKLHSGVTGGVVHCGGNLKCKFIENSTVVTMGDVTADSVINSNVVCGKNVRISGMIAKIIGGTCVAGGNIEANTIGSVSSVRTKLELGAGQTVLHRQKELTAKVAELEKQIARLTPLRSLFSQLEASNRLTPDKRETMEKVNYSYEESTRMLEEAKKELEEIGESVKSRGFGRIICYGMIHPGTKIVIGEAVLDVTDTLKFASVYYSKGEIAIGAAR